MTSPLSKRNVVAFLMIASASSGGFGCPSRTLGPFMDGGVCFYRFTNSNEIRTVDCTLEVECEAAACTTNGECAAAQPCVVGSACGRVTTTPSTCVGGACVPTDETENGCSYCPAGSNCKAPTVCVGQNCVLLDGGNLVDRCEAAACAGTRLHWNGCRGATGPPACNLLATCGFEAECGSDGLCAVDAGSADGGCAQCSPDGGCPGSLDCVLGYCVCTLVDGGC